MAGDAERLGIYGFGAAAHIIAQVARHEGREVYAFTREGDDEAQTFARKLGAVWAGGSTQTSPEELDAAIIFAPVGALVPAALKAVRKGGIVVAGCIHMSDIPSFPYERLWGERILRSVANLTRHDAEAFLDLGAVRSRQDPCRVLSARSGQRGACLPSRGPPPWCRGTGADVFRLICLKGYAEKPAIVEHRRP